jgi:uncharacterized protein YktB (UPF0637 family)
VTSLGFKTAHFEVFKTEDFNERMAQIYALVRPKLLKLGEELAPELSRRLSSEFYPHVAKHARRTVNPPPETWAAFGPSPRGYKRYSYLALCISRVGLHARVVVKSEADHRVQMADRLRNTAEKLTRQLRGTPVARYDGWGCGRPPATEPASADLFLKLAETLTKKTGGMDLGIGWSVQESVRLDRAELLDAFRELDPIYRTLREASALTVIDG